MTPHDDGWLERVSLHADDELEGRDRAEMQDHLAECSSCSAALVEFRQLRSWLSSDIRTDADRRAPASWADMRKALPPRSLADRYPHWQRLLLAASILTAAVIGGRMVTRTDDAPRPRVAAAIETPESRATLELEQLVRERLATLPPKQSEALASSIHIIDSAIADARAARTADPTDYFVATYLGDLLKRRIDALRQVVEVSNAETT